MYRSLLRSAGRVFIPAGVSVNQVVRQSSCTAPEPPPLPAIDVLLYQYRICPFCHIIRANLDFMGIPYRTVEVNPVTQSELEFIEKPRKVPVVVLEGEVVRESDVIVMRVKGLIESKSGDKTVLKELFPADTEKWMAWAKEQLAVKIYPNITRNFSEAWQAFSYTGDVTTWSWYERWGNRVVGPVAMFFANGKVKKKYNIIDERKELLATVQEWKAAIGTNNYLHGDVVTSPDLCVYGVLRAIAGFDTFNLLMEDPSLRAWYDRVDGEVEKRKAK